VIVADASLLFPFAYQSPNSAWAEAVHARDPHWRFPPLWREEFSSALLKHTRAGLCSAAVADQALAAALDLFAPFEQRPDPRLALRLAIELGLSAYDAQYAALAHQLGTVVVTADKALVKKAKGLAVGLEEVPPSIRS
jgi:predicted nucleic acid-binding protein